MISTFMKHEDEFIYTAEHASKALEIVRRLLPHVRPRPEYDRLVTVLADSSRWHEAHALFNDIRVRITLPSESYGGHTLDDYFVYIAENAAKTAYNCSGRSAPFDEDSFEWLLKCEQRFITELTPKP
jgi:hypothetical protein